jgi:hypothetical protein
VCLISSKVLDARHRGATTGAYGNTPQGGAIEGNAADDALMVDQALENRLKKRVELCILKSPLGKRSIGVKGI